MSRGLAFFGAFNPPTLAHVELARYAGKRLQAPCVVFVPSKSEYITGQQHKEFAFSDAERLEMLEAVARQDPLLEVTDFELHQPRQMYTYETLCHLRDSGRQLSLLIGADKLMELGQKWRYVPQIAEEFGIVCMDRGEADTEEILRSDPVLRPLSEHIRLLHVPDDWKNVSSTRVRACLREGDAETLKALVPPEILPLLLVKQAARA